MMGLTGKASKVSAIGTSALWGGDMIGSLVLSGV
jgi:hypothetical protein